MRIAYKTFWLSFLITILLAFPSKSFATNTHPLKEILGVSSASELPATIEGPGFVLPQSPLYVLDKLKQNILLSLSFSPDKKIETYNAIAGERIAELKIEIEDGEVQGIDTALAELTSTISQARGEVENLNRRGKLNPQIALKLNDDIRSRFVYLNNIEAQLTGSLKTKVKAAARSLLEDKIKIAIFLPSDIASKEEENDLKLAINQSIEDMTDSTAILQKAFEEKASSSPSAKKKLKDESTTELEKIIGGVQKLAQAINEGKTESVGSAQKEKTILLPSIIEAQY